MEEEFEDTKKLGGNIELSGFSLLDRDTIVIVKKMVGSYARKFSDTLDDFEKLSLRMKPVHNSEAPKNFELYGKLVRSGKVITSEVNDRNLFFAIDSIMKKIEKQIS